MDGVLFIVKHAASLMAIPESDL